MTDSKDKKPRIGIIIGSNRPGRISHTIAEWVMRAMKHDALKISLADLAEINVPFLDEPGIPACYIEK